MTFGAYWSDVLQDTKSGPTEPLNPLIYSDLSLDNITHKSVLKQASPVAKIKYTLGTLP
jgi:hypothetical protein